jgi:hypothetical protein
VTLLLGVSVGLLVLVAVGGRVWVSLCCGVVGGWGASRAVAVGGIQVPYGISDATRQWRSVDSSYRMVTACTWGLTRCGT